MVSARVWLTCEAVRHHSKCTPTALTMMDISTRPEIALRIPMRMRISWLRSVTARYGSSQRMLRQAVRSTQFCDPCRGETSGMFPSYKPIGHDGNSRRLPDARRFDPGGCSCGSHQLPVALRAAPGAALPDLSDRRHHRACRQ